MIISLGLNKPLRFFILTIHKPVVLSVLFSAEWSEKLLFNTSNSRGTKNRGPTSPSLRTRSRRRSSAEEINALPNLSSSSVSSEKPIVSKNVPKTDLDLAGPDISASVSLTPAAEASEVRDIRTDLDSLEQVGLNCFPVDGTLFESTHAFRCITHAHHLSVGAQEAAKEALARQTFRARVEQIYSKYAPDNLGDPTFLDKVRWGHALQLLQTFALPPRPHRMRTRMFDREQIVLRFRNCEAGLIAELERRYNFDMQEDACRVDSSEAKLPISMQGWLCKRVSGGTWKNRIKRRLRGSFLRWFELSGCTLRWTKDPEQIEYARGSLLLTSNTVVERANKVGSGHE